MTPWDKISEIFKNRIFILMKSPAAGDRWISNLYDAEDGILLAISICIDILTGSVEPKIFAEILDLINPTALNAREEFANAQKKHPGQKNFYCASKIVSKPLDSDDSYIRILELKGFIDYYAGPTDGYSSLDPSDINEVRDKYFNPSLNLGIIDKWWAGGNGRVWVMPYSEFQKILMTNSVKHYPTILNDRLGLGYEVGIGEFGKPELVAVIYPKSFSVGCKQPTALDAMWNNSGSFYISNDSAEGWGKTQSCTGIREGISERVHSEFKNLTSDYKTTWIGFSENINSNRDALLEEAYRRFMLLQNK